MKRKLPALILGAAALTVGFGSLAVAGVVAHKDAIVQTKAAEQNVTLSNIGEGLGGTANTTAATTTVSGYVLNYYQCKKQTLGSEHSMLLTKKANPYISNHTEIPGSIVSVTIKTGNGSSAKTSYRCTFGTNEFTEAPTTGGETAIPGTGKTHTFTNSGSNAVSGATYFALSLGNDNNGQIANITIVYDDGSTASYIGLSDDSAEVGIAATANITLSRENGLVANQWSATPANLSIASASINGDVLTVTGVALGATTVTVAALDSKGSETATATVTVTVNAYSITLSQKSATLGLQESKAITVTNNYAAANTATVSASSNDTSIATVAKESDGTFTITGVSAGSAKVTFTGVDNAGQEASAYVNVTVKVKELSFKLSETPSSLTLESGAHDIKITNPNNYGDSISYEASSSNVSVATVSVNEAVNEATVTITPVAKGTTTITVTGTGSNGSSATQSFDLEVVGQGELVTTPIGSLRNKTGDGLADGFNKTDTYKIQGVYIGKRFNSTYKNKDQYDLFIQQGDSAIMLYRLYESAFEGLQEGDLITATGTLDIYNGTLQMKDAVITIVESGKTVSPLQLTADNIGTLGNDSRLVRCDNAKFVSSSVSEKGDVSYVFKLSDGVTEVTVFDKKNAVLGDVTLTADQTYNIEGIKGVFTKDGNTSHQIYVLSADLLADKTDADAADTWAVNFLDATYPCTTAASGAWSSQQTAFASLSEKAQNILIKATYSVVTYDDATNVQKAVWRYDLAVLRQGLNDFMNRKPVSGKDASLFAFDSKETQNTVLISTLGAAALVAAAGFIFLKKKKA